MYKNSTLHQNSHINWTGFLQVRENWKSQEICVVRERSRKNNIFENDVG